MIVPLLWLVQQSIEGLTSYFMLADHGGIESQVRNQAAAFAPATLGSPVIIRRCPRA